MKRFPILLTVLISSSFVSSCTTVNKTSLSVPASKPKLCSTESVASRISSKRRTVRTTAYSHEENEPGAYGKKNAAGTTLKYGSTRSAAADWSRYPLGTKFKIVGKPHVYEIDDYGSALVGTGTIDLYKPNLKLMNEWGVRHVDIQIIKWGCFEKSAAILSKRTKYAHCRKMYQGLQPQLKRSRRSTNPDSRFPAFSRG